jgi:hypothetical protein
MVCRDRDFGIEFNVTQDINQLAARWVDTLG